MAHTHGCSSATTARPEPHPARPLLTVTARQAPPDATVVTVRGEVDLLTAPLLRDRLLPLMRDTVIIDLAGVTFFAAAGLTVLVEARRTAEAAGIRLSLVAPTRQVLLPLTITGLAGMFDVAPGLTHALLRAGRGPDG